MLGHVFLAIVGLVGELDAMFSADIDIDVVVPDTVPDKQSAFCEFRQDGFGHLDHVDDDDVGIDDFFEDVGFRFELELVGLEVDAGFCELFGFPVQVVFDIAKMYAFDSKTGEALSV